MREPKLKKGKRLQNREDNSKNRHQNPPLFSPLLSPQISRNQSAKFLGFQPKQRFGKKEIEKLDQCPPNQRNRKEEESPMHSNQN